jgi:AcrR family transcriptional regulator
MRSNNMPAEPPDSQATRTRLLDAAAALFARRGYEGASTRAIAERARVHQALVRHHFGGKEALWREVIERGLRALSEELAQAGAGADRVAALLAATAAHAEPVQVIAHALLDPGERREWLLQRLVPLHARSLAWLTRGERVLRGARDEALLCMWLAAALAPVLLGPALAAAGRRTLDAPGMQRMQHEALVPWLRGTPPAQSEGAWSLAAAQRRRALSPR